MPATQELVDYYDETGQLIGHCTRSQAEDNNYTTPNAIIFIFNTSGKVLLQKRADDKKHYPGLWDTSACGGLEHGEEPELAAERELFEEIGIKTDLMLVEKFINPFPSEDGKLIRTRLSHLFIGVSDQMPTHNHEVSEIRAFDPDKLLKLVADKPSDFVPSFELEISKALADYKKLIGGWPESAVTNNL